MTMNINSREKDVQAKQEGETNEHCKISGASSTSSRQWTGFRNPRIVRVSRAFGGKDRHSKVCTIRGLRDRRIRLSVPTAIQLYDLQDRLGLNQPSKVVDWLLDATKNEIEKLPPLQMPPGNFSQFHHPAIASTGHQASLSQFFFDSNSADMKDNGGSQTLFSSRESINVNNPDGDMSDKCKEAEREAAAMAKFKWINAANEQEKLESYGGYLAQLSAQNFLQLANQSSFSGLLNNAAFSYNTYFHLEPSFNHSVTFQAEDSQNNNHSLAFPSSMALSSGSQLYFCPSMTTIPTSSVPPHMMTTQVENDQQRDINHLQLFSSSTSQNIVPPNSLMPTLHLMSSSQEKDDSQQNKGGASS